MGISSPNKGVREAACLGCIVKCEGYNHGASYFPAKLHKVPYALRGLPEMLHHYCVHFDPTRIPIGPENRNIYK